MCYNSIIDKKIPCSFILMNNKSQKSYELVLKKLYNIITFEDSKALKLISITSDFEKGLINAIKTVFKKTRHVGCFFHYVKNVRLNMLKIGLLSDDVKNISVNLLNRLAQIPFFINNNIEIIKEIFKEYDKIYHNLKLTVKFKIFRDYFIITWSEYFETVSLNNIYLIKSKDLIPI